MTHDIIIQILSSPQPRMYAQEANTAPISNFGGSFLLSSFVPKLIDSLLLLVFFFTLFGVRCIIATRNFVLAFLSQAE